MRLAALAIPLLVIAMPTLADPYPQWGICGSDGNVALHRIEITGGTADSTIYLDDENWLLGNGIWVFLETNGVWTPKPAGVYFEGLSNENLQRGGGSPWVPGDSDICYDDGPSVPDMMLL